MSKYAVYVISVLILISTLVYYSFSVKSEKGEILVEVSEPVSSTSLSYVTVTSISTTAITTTVKTVTETTAVKTTALKTTAIKPATVKTTESVKTEEETLTETEPAEQETEFTEEVEEPLWIDINTATPDELMKLNGVGEKISADIVAYRDSHGGFRNIEEIMLVNGIGEGIFSEIKDFIYVVNPTYEMPVQEVTVPAVEVQVQTETVTEHVKTLEECVPININTASIDELMLLPYVDNEIAEEIVKIRNEIGGYSHVYELLYVEKLTQKQTAEIVNFVTIGQ